MSDTGQTQTPTQTPEQTNQPNELAQTGQTTDQSTNQQGDKGPGSVFDDKSNEPAPEPFDESKLTLPEGFEKGENWEKFTNIAKGLSHSQAQELIGLAEASVKAREEAVFGRWHEQITNWQKEIKADQELGGTNFETMKQTVAKVLDNPELSDPGVRDALAHTGAGSNPALVRTLYRWAKALTEGASVAGGAPTRNADGSTTTEPRSTAQRMYPEGPHSGGPNLRS